MKFSPIFSLTLVLFGCTQTTKDPTDDTGVVDTSTPADTSPTDTSTTPDTDLDNDGLSNDLEEFLGTDPENADTDGDGVDDATEVVLGLDPLNPDTDGDGYSDFEEVLAKSNPNDSNDTPNSVDQELSCTSAVEITSDHFFEATGDSSYYGKTWDSEGEVGSACTCSFTLNNRGARNLIGVTIWAPTAAYEGTDWESTPIPKGVMISVPWDGEVDFEDETFYQSLSPTKSNLIDDSGDKVEHWFAFEPNPDWSDWAEFSTYDTDGNWVSTALPSSLVSPDGTYHVIVSYINSNGQSLPGCDLLGMDGGDQQPMKLRIDTTYTVDYEN